jgi:hypothetical protein
VVARGERTVAEEPGAHLLADADAPAAEMVRAVSEILRSDDAPPASIAASKLDVKSGDTLVFSVPEGLTYEQMSSVVNQYAKEGKDVFVISLRDNMKLESLDEDQMRLAGWVRASPEAAT